MKIVQPDKLVKTDDYYLKPKCRYVVSDYELDILLTFTSQTNWNWSSFNAYERRYGGQSLNGKSLCIYRHNAWGDQLIASAVPRWLKTKWPGATIHLYCHPKVLPLWLGNPFVEGCAIPLPIPFDAVKHYDYHAFYEGMLEGNSEKDQECCYDDFFSVIGMDPKEVPPELKRPCIFPRPEDYIFWNEQGLAFFRPYLLYHLSPDNGNRCYPVNLGMKFLKLFLDAFPKHNVIIVGTDKEQQYTNMIQLLFFGHPRVLNLVDKTRTFRDLIPIIEGASAVVCPDSAIMHLAACFPNVPVVSLWGLFAPQDRIKYYPRNKAIFHPEVCPHSPCHDHNFYLPKESCKDATPHRNKDLVKECFVLSSIQPEEILAEVELVCAT